MKETEPLTYCPIVMTKLNSLLLWWSYRTHNFEFLEKIVGGEYYMCIGSSAGSQCTYIPIMIYMKGIKSALIPFRKEKKNERDKCVTYI